MYPLAVSPSASYAIPEDIPRLGLNSLDGRRNIKPIPSQSLPSTPQSDIPRKRKSDLAKAADADELLLDTVKELRASIGRSSSFLTATSCLGDVGRGTIPSVHLYRETRHDFWFLFGYIRTLDLLPHRYRIRNLMIPFSLVVFLFSPSYIYTVSHHTHSSR
jgi:hypothetical protein